MNLPFDEPVATGHQFIDLAREFATAILRTIEDGWALELKSPEVNTGAKEVEITERLRDGMRRALKLGRMPWGKTM